MNVNENEFFRECTLRLCGSLDVEKALHSFLTYVRQFIPANQAALNIYDQEAGVIEVVTMATISSGEITRWLIPLSEEARHMSSISPLPELLLINRVNEHPIFRHVRHLMDSSENSLLVVRLFVDGHRLGGLTLRARGHDRFNEHHLHLLSLLNRPVAITLSNYLRYRELKQLKDRLSDDNRYLRHQLNQALSAEVIGADFGLKEVFQMVRQIAPMPSSVLLLGETGTGKEVIAGAIHNLSPRRDGPFIKVNCGAIPNTLIDSELFGHEKGAFTGALSQRHGRFEMADCGTIFLDEIGEMPPDAQLRLLRVLQDKEVVRVGGTQTIKVDVRVIAATHQDIEDMATKGMFRKDLFFMLNVFPIKIPPLRERIHDIPALVHHFLEEKTRELRISFIPKLAPDALSQLSSYLWPGNVRELENVIERALILSHGEPLSFAGLVTNKILEGPSLLHQSSQPMTLDDINAVHIKNVLLMTGGKIHGRDGAANLLGINPSTLRARMEKLGIKYRRKETMISVTRWENEEALE
ncbi:MAG: sigma 54-interacting transcriptional regulator [Deltaproteobacteria bacterium]|nr:sigma 54-interacting transcriptional regulator [Deltaproteobacteria bacterium]